MSTLAVRDTFIGATKMRAFPSLNAGFRAQTVVEPRYLPCQLRETKEHTVVRRDHQTITLAAVGDIMLEQRLSKADIAAVRPFLADADIAIANLDTVLSPLGDPVPKWVNLRGPRREHELLVLQRDHL
ncbi:MAG: hypothetical protein C4346_17830, partial [Chloroflexota bacterium]